MNWLAHPTCQTPPGKMRNHQEKADVKCIGDLYGELGNSFARVTAEYKLNIHDFYRISLVKGFTYIQRHCRAAKKGFLAGSIA